MLKELINLYSISFDDGKEYVDYFFNHKYSPDNTLTVTDNNTIISALFLIPKTLGLSGINVPCPWIVGACTHPDYRKMGVMNRLLYDTLLWLHQENYSLTALYPFRHSFYERQGFVSVSYSDKGTIIHDPKTDYTLRDADLGDIDAMVELYNKFMADIDIFILRDYDSMRVRYNEALITGKVKLIFLGNDLVGYIMYDTSDIIEAIGCGFQAVAELDNKTYERYDNPIDKNIMARIVKPMELLSTITYPIEIDTTIKINIQDRFFNLNNIALSLTIKNGKAKVIKCEEWDYQLTIEELTHMVFGSYENTDYNPPSTLRNIFPPKTSIITDKY